MVYACGAANVLDLAVPARSRKLAAQSGEVGVVDTSYPVGDARRYGIIPDGTTDWDAAGNIDAAAQTSAALGVPIWFPAGYYASGVEIARSNVTFAFERGARWGGLFHVGGVEGAKITDVALLGTVATYDRFGCYWIDRMQVDRVHVLADGAKNTQSAGVAGRGVHIYTGTTELSCGEIVVEQMAADAPNAYAAVEVDGWSAAGDRCEHLDIGRIWVKDSDLHGVYLVGRGHRIGEIRVDNYGTGTYPHAVGMQDANSLAQSQELKGVWLNRCYDTAIGRVIVSGAGGANSRYDVLVDESGVWPTFGSVDIREIVVTNLTGTTRRGVSIADANFAPSTRAHATVGSVKVRAASWTAPSGYKAVNVMSPATAHIPLIDVQGTADDQQVEAGATLTQ